MDAFALAVQGWHDFYMLIGTAAATLIGLLFLSLSLHLPVITGRQSAAVRALALHTFGDFMSVLMFAVVFLIPQQVPLGLGLPLLAIGGYGVYNTIRHWLTARRQPTEAGGVLSSIGTRFVLPAVCFLGLMGIAVSLLLGQTGELYWLVPVMLILVVTASRNAWYLLMALRPPAKRG